MCSVCVCMVYEGNEGTKGNEENEGNEGNNGLVGESLVRYA